MRSLDQHHFSSSANNETLLIDKNFSFEDSYRVSPDIPQWVCTVQGVPEKMHLCLGGPRHPQFLLYYGPKKQRCIFFWDTLRR